MKHPLWILNSSLLALLVFSLIFVVATRETVPPREEIEPEPTTAEPVKKDSSRVNISKIYDYDLFGTYQKEVAKPEEPDFVIPLPEAPTPKEAKVPKIPEPEFLDPLKVTLKGIVMVGDDARNSAIIADNDTKQETNYKKGDTIDDAQLIRILKNKVVFIRSNGQEEVLYLRQADAEHDPEFDFARNWQDVVKRVSDTEYQVNPITFAERIKNLAQFIDALDLTTAYSKGKSAGCRIGNAAQNSLGAALGLQKNDIILSIAGLPATETENRIAIYRKVSESPLETSVPVSLRRGGQEYTIEYQLQDFRPPLEKKEGEAQAEKSEESQTPKKPSPQEVTAEQLRTMRERHNFAPTLQELRAQERKNMLQRGRPSLNRLRRNVIE